MLNILLPLLLLNSDALALSGPQLTKVCNGFNLGGAPGDINVSKLLSVNYNKYRPPSTLTPVHLQFNINGISKLDEKTHSLTLDVSFLRTWIDGRLSGHEDCKKLDQPKALLLMKPTEADKPFWKYLWQPVIEIDNEKLVTPAQLTTPADRMMIYKSGRVFVFQRFTVVIKCNMDFSSYPFDSQSCSFSMKAGFSKFPSVNAKFSLFDFPDFPEYRTEMKLPNWKVTVDHPNVKNEPWANNKLRNKASASATMTFTRVRINYALSTFIPSLMLCIICILSMFIPSQLVPARMGLSITTFLTIISMFNGARRDAPVTAYAKSLDVWFLASFMLVFTVLAEYIAVLAITQGVKIVVALSTTPVKIQINPEKPGIDSLASSLASLDSAASPEPPKPKTDAFVSEETIGGTKEERNNMIAQKIEMVAKIVVPITYIIFLIVFLIAYL